MGGYKMKKIILYTLSAFSSVSLMAVDGAALYKKRCAKCHGEKAQKSPLKNVAPIAGMNTTILARITRSYRDQDSRYGTAHTMHRENQLMKEATSSLSDQQIGAISKHINGLEK